MITSKKWGLLLSTAVSVIVLDQWSKYVVRTDTSWQYFDIIKGWLAFHYTQNPGMALGIDWLPTQVIGSITTIAIIFITFYLIKLAKNANLAQIFCFGLIIGGALGNIFDRMFMGIIQGRGGFMDGHVVDFIHFTLRINNWDVFPYIFNIADVAISCSVISMFLFYKHLMPEEFKTHPKTETAIEKQAEID
ncbi:MAG: signal peptidase II [Bacteroidetes bacterium]|nr:signal peptidase II [Bacteroidota bacterium]NCQ11877.1 signal peptidase II [Bacteroidota bacterium]